MPFMIFNYLQIFSTPAVLKVRKTFELRKWRRGLGLNLQTHLGVAKPKSILIATNIGGNLNTMAFDAVLGIALRSRGHKVNFTLCDGALTACMYCELNKFKSLGEYKSAKAQKLCNGCSKTGQQILNLAGFNAFLMKANGKSSSENWDLEIADSGTKRFLAKGRIDDQEEYRTVFEEYLKSSQIVNGEAKEIFSKNQFDLMIAHHGIYVPQGNMVAVAKEFDIPVVTWVQGYRKQSFLLGIGDTYHKSLLTESYDVDDLQPDEKKEIMEYLDSRDIGERDWIKFSSVSRNDSTNIDLGQNKTKVLLLTNVSWDAQLHYSSRLFPDMHAWIDETIQWFKRNSHLDLIVRIHPAEISGKIKARDPILKFIEEKFPNLPTNIKVIGPEDKVSTYKLMDICDLGLIFATKAGIELAVLGKPLIVAGESWIRGRGLSVDPTTKQEYFAQLEKFSKNPNSLPTNVESALKFAHYFFFQKTQKVNSIKALSHYPYLRPQIKRDWEFTDPGLLNLIHSIENL
jgi:hypothetical protein